MSALIATSIGLALAAGVGWGLACGFWLRGQAWRQAYDDLRGAPTTASTQPRPRGLDLPVRETPRGA